MKLWIKMGISTLVFLIMLMAFSGCGTSGRVRRAAVQDGTFYTQALGFSPQAFIEVATTFSGNAIAGVEIVTHGETAHFMEAVERHLIPRIVENQSIGVDTVAGATMSSFAVLQAVRNAIDLAGGVSSQWTVALPRDRTTVILPADGGDPFDVIVIGLGGAGMAAFLSAAEQANTTVFGIERSATVGGLSVIGNGIFALNSQISPAQGDIERFMYHFGVVFGGQASGSSPSMLEVRQENNGWAGPARMDIFRRFLEESGTTMNWMLDSGWQIHNVANAVGNWRPDLVATTHLVTVGPQRVQWFNRAKASALAKNPRNDYMLDLRATRILTEDGTPTGRIIGVEAEHRDGRTFIIHGRTVFIGTGGYIANAAMQIELHGSVVSPFAILASGDGITMARRDVSAASYNLATSPILHLPGFRNFFTYEQINHPDVTDREIDGRWKQTFLSLLQRPQNLTVALAIGHDGGDRRGQRFMGEATTPFAPNQNRGMIRNIGNEGRRAGGNWAAIFSNDQLFRLMVEPIGHQQNTMPHHRPLGVAVPADQPVTFLQPLIHWAINVGNAVQADSLERLAQHLEFDAVVTARFLETIHGYNAIVEIARGHYAAGTTTWPGQNTAVRGSTPDPMSAVFNELQGLYNLGKPLYGGAGNAWRLWEQSVTINLEEQTANANAWGISEGFTPGFTAILGRTFSYGSVGGLDVNTRMQVLRFGTGTNHLDQEPIPGLFAGGLDSLGVLHHRNRTYSNAGAKGMGWVFTSGRMAGRYAAQDAAAMRAARN